MKKNDFGTGSHPPEHLPVRDIEPAELLAWKEDDRPMLLLDVREAYEHDDFDIGGILMPMGEVMSRKDEIPRHKPVILYCRKGLRSAIVIQRLQDRFGFDNLFNLRGGIENWKLRVPR